MPQPKIRPLAALFLGAAMVLALPPVLNPALAEEAAPPAKPGPTITIDTSTKQLVVVHPEGDIGAYLAARSAAQGSDYRAGAIWFSRALVSDPDDPGLLQGAVASYIGTGEFGLAAAAADRLLASGEKNQIAFIARLANRAKTGDFEGILADAKAGTKIGALMDGLTAAWAELGAGRTTEALAGFDTIAKTPAIASFGLYHKALALASVGDFEGAEAIFAAKDNPPITITRRGVMAHVQILSQLERNDEALKVLNAAFGEEPDPGLDPMRDELKAGKTLPFDIATSPVDGMAEVFYTLATALNGEADDSYTLIYARAATFLRPDLTEAALMAAGLLERQKQWDLAAGLYSTVSADNPAFYIAEIGRASATYELGRKEAAYEILETLARKYPQNATVLVSLGDTLRQDEKWTEALKAYDAALDLPMRDDPGFWTVWYARGICHERLGDFDKAEADMLQALKLQPDQPNVLNYLGYSYVDRGENLDKALDMIQRAVNAKPDSGYIIDSLAWALYRMGRYDQALPHMEKASLLEPVDPVVTDHLGDVYWAVDRKMEARFQWRRALSFSPEEKDAARIRKKLEVGLDKVLADEGAKPLTPVKSVEAKPADSE